MARGIIPLALTDWQQLDSPLFSQADLSREENFGIHRYNDRLWTSGFVGVGRLFGRDGKPLRENGMEVVAVIRSRFGMDPWRMLEKVMTDDEFESYQQALNDENKCLFKVFYDQPLIRLSQEDEGSDILCALSFINSCFSLCKKGLRKQMLYREENFSAKVRGKIDIRENIRRNTVKGRNDRFYCKYIDFTEDNAENRIIKAALVRCKRIVEEKFTASAEIQKRCGYCMNALRRVKLTQIKPGDLANANAGGLYTYYRPLLSQARVILSQKYRSFAAENGRTISRSVYTVPYMINMEAVFEFFARICIKESLRPPLYIESYSKRIPLKKKESSAKTHLMDFCIPDVIIKDDSGAVVAALDVKYKSFDRESRSDSHQLLSYALLTGTGKCGFILPAEKSELRKLDGNSTSIELNSPNKPLHYFELLLGNDGFPDS